MALHDVYSYFRSWDRNSFEVVACQGNEPTEADVEPLTWMLWERARTQDTITFLSAEGRLQSFARSLVAFFDRFDAVLTPALARPPVPIGEIHGKGPDPWGNYQRSGHFTPFTLR